MQFVPTESWTTGRCICIRTGYNNNNNNNNNTQARRSRVSTNFTCLLATFECSFIQVKIKFCFIALQAQRIRMGTFFSSAKFQSSQLIVICMCFFFFYHLKRTAVLCFLKFNCYFSVAYLG